MLRMARRLFLAALAVLFGNVAATSAADAERYWVYFGTYTSKDGSKGINRCQLDVKTGKLSEPEVAAAVGSPSFVNFSPDGKFLYAVGESAGKNGGGVYAYSVDAVTGNLTKLNEQGSVGAGPCHVEIDPSGKVVLVANYGGGSTTSFAVKDDGSLSEKVSFMQHKGTSADKSRQSAPHAHCSAFDASGKFGFVCDLGLDQVIVYKVSANGELSANDPAFIKMPSGCGPRHIHINSKNTIAYVNGELDMTVNVVKMDVAAGKFEVIQSLSTVPEGKPMPGYSTAEVRIHPSGQFVYVSNRGQHSVAAFEVIEGGKLKPIGHIVGNIKTPRGFNIDPSGKWMLVANQDSNSVRVFEIDQKTGMATKTENVIKVGSPVCVKFLAVAK